MKITIEGTPKEVKELHYSLSNKAAQPECVQKIDSEYPSEKPEGIKIEHMVASLRVSDATKSLI